MYENVNVIKIKGVLPHLVELLADLLVRGNKLEKALVIKRYTQDIQRYIESLEEIDYGYTYAALIYTLEKKNFEFTNKLAGPGQFSRKGDTVSFWPIGYKNPVRAEFFDEELEKLTFFDELYGTNLLETKSLFVGNLSILDDRVEWENLVFKSYTDNANLAQNRIFSKSDLSLDIGVKDQLHVLIFQNSSESAKSQKEFNFSYPPIFYGRIDLMNEELAKLEAQGYKILIETGDVHNEGIKPKWVITQALDLAAGFIDNKAKVVYITSREIYGTIFLNKEKSQKINSKQARKLLNELEGEIQIGDYLVHEDHGIGIYSGVTREQDQEYILLKYADSDELLIPLDQIHKVTKYIGVSGEEPVITNLGRVDWKKVTGKVKKAISIIAKDLVAHYAKLELAEAKAVLIEDSERYKQFEGRFEFKETTDQIRTIDQVLKDISSSKPMNRLIVGDVGFGKTEVAMRAAFKVVESGMQVAVLCPTTVLAAQHYKVFSDRFDGLGIKVAMMSRFSGTRVNSQIAEQLNSSSINIVIGTHRLLSSDVKFKNLGLVIIDEEQKFGVAQKEKLKKLKYGAHILSMTATPIPRTLSMALSEIQDISIISTPPEGRKEIKTTVEKKNINKVANIIKNEIDRGGQAYYIHNRVQTIEAEKAKLQSLLPNVRFVTAHGQMPEKHLEKVINDFYNKKYDVLICTTIIENGIDMPNVNTIIINKSQNFGLGQLYQLRGRVGRSTKQAYAYLFYDGKDIDKTQGQITSDQTNSNFTIQNSEKDKSHELSIEEIEEKKYMQRLQAMKELAGIGGGFQIASRDLEIRGAGNLLGREQHGSISKVGLGLYMQMLAEEIEKLKIKN